MPGVMALMVSLSEILEAQGRPCKELEIWALLCQCAETLQDLIIKGEAVSSNGFQYMLTPNNLLVEDNGNITIGAAPKSFQGSLYMAPEFDSFSVQNMSETAFEKIFVYSLGRTLQVASEFGLKQNEVLNISYDLDSLLQTMTERDATVRTGLIHLLEACALQSTQHSTTSSPSHILSRLYKIVLESKLKILSMDSHCGSECDVQKETHKMPGRMRRPRPQIRHQRTQRHSFSSRSRSRSGSHSPYRSRSQESEHHFGVRRLHDRPRTAAILPASSILATESHTLNKPVTSSVSDESESFLRRKVTQIPSSSSASHCSQRLPGLRQGRPAFQKYVQLKERQIRLQQARKGTSQSNMENVYSRLISQELVDKTPETVSMTSLMSFTMGSYMPYLYNQFETETSSVYDRNYETDVESMIKRQKSLDQSQGDKDEMYRAATEHEVSDMNTSSMSLAINPTRTEITTEGGLKLIEDGRRNIPLKVGPKSEKRQYFGPEFVFKARKPEIKIAMPFQNNVKNTTHVCPLTVVHLTGQKFEITLDSATTGRQLMDAVISYTDLDDCLFFGLTYISDGEHVFLGDDTKLHKIAPKGWKEVSKSTYSLVGFTLYLRIKFYPEFLTDFRNKSSIHLLYLQLRRDVVEGNIECEDQILFKLAGIALQVEYGDYDQMSCVHTYFQAEQYVSKAAIKRLGSSSVYRRITEEHLSCFGTQSSDAETAFIKHVKQLPGYGVHFYKLSKFKSQVNQFVWIGLSQYNLVLSAIDSSKGTIVQAYPWSRIMKISFNKCRFSIQPNVEVAKGKPPKLNFYTKSHRKGRYMLQFALDQHRFQIRMKTRSSKMGTFADEIRSVCGPLHVDASVGHGNDAYDAAPVVAYPSQQLLQCGEDDDEGEEIEDENHRYVYSKPPHPYQSPPPYQPPSMVESLVDHLILPGMNEIALDTHVANNTAWNFPELNKVLEMSCRTTSPDSALAIEQSAQEEVSLLESSQLPHSGRHIFKVILEREDKFGIGLTIVGGETTNSLDLGIFIKSVTPGSPAARDGRLKPGDRLIAIDGLSLEGKQHHEAVTLIRDAGPQIELLISQNRPPGTLRKTGIPSYQDSFEKKMESSFSEKNMKNNSLILERDRMALEHSSQSETPACFDYDDMFKEDNHINLITSNACISDVDNPPITCNSTSPLPALPSQPPPSPLVNFPYRYQESEEQDKDNEAADQAFCDLHVDHELSYHIGTEWSNRSADHSTMFHHDRLTEAETEDIQILGDIAALDVEASSSDSDFDTAVKNTLAGSGLNKHCKTSAETLSHKGFENHTRKNLQDVIYEVILERQNGPYGIVMQIYEHSKDYADNIFIKEISFGSSAQMGGILAPGDRIMEIQGQSVANMSIEEAYAVLDSAKDFCAVKISRASHIDGKLGHHPGRKHQHKNDSGLDSGLTYFTEHAGSLSCGWKPENKCVKPTQSSPTLSRSHGILPLLLENKNSQDKELNIVISPPASLLDAEDSESNTQSDVDSDVLDSSRSELEYIHRHSQQFLGDKPEESSTATLNNSAPKTQIEDMNSSCLKQFKIETNMATEADGNKVQINVVASLKDSMVNLIPIDASDGHLIEKDVSLRNYGLHSSKSSSKEATCKLDDIGTDPSKSANDDELSLMGKATYFPERETDSKIEEKITWDETENHKIKDKAETIDKLPGGGLLEPDGDFSQGYRHSEWEDKIKDFEEEGSARSSVLRPQIYNPELVETTLVRVPGGSFGFTISGDLTTGGCYIKHLVSSPLAQFGTLFPGDKLLMVNSEDTTSLNHVEAVSLLRNGPDEVKLKLLRYPSSMQTQEQLLMIKNFIKQKEREDNEHEGNVTSALDSHSSVHDLIKPSDKKTDAIINEPYDKEQTRNQTSASECIGSRSMYLSQSITDGTVEVLPKMREERLKSQSKETETEFCTEEMEMINIDLIKPSQLGSNLGISLVDQEIDGQSMVVVKRIKSNGIAHKDGRLQTGDIVLQVNTMPLVKVKAQEAAGILRKSKDRVLLTLSRLKDRTRLTGSEIIQNTDVVYENSTPVDSPEDGPLTRGHEARYISCRTLNVSVPLIMSHEWLADLPLISLPEPKAKKGNYATSILQSLVDMVERGEPAEEFKNIRQSKSKGDKMCSVGQMPENKLKNRFRNILPYDSNRVKLKDPLEGDYINASYISVRLTNMNDIFRYIACQGPLEETVHDFWNMLWQEKVNVIAMLTTTVEKDKIKCHVYWPQRTGESLSFVESRIQVKHVRSYKLQSFDVIQLAVEERATGMERKMTILQYTRWPDQGAPDTALPMLQLLQVLHLYENGQPPLIHCSAGVGRTGVLIATDIALAFIEKEVKFDLYQIVCSLRSQRQGMIQTTDQYAFCYTACMEAILSDEMHGT